MLTVANFVPAAYHGLKCQTTILLEKSPVSLACSATRIKLVLPSPVGQTGLNRDPGYVLEILGFTNSVS